MSIPFNGKAITIDFSSPVKRTWVGVSGRSILLPHWNDAFDFGLASSKALCREFVLPSNNPYVRGNAGEEPTISPSTCKLSRTIANSKNVCWYPKGFFTFSDRIENLKQHILLQGLKLKFLELTYISADEATLVSNSSSPSFDGGDFVSSCSRKGFSSL
jgi:hypothetical protein